MIINHGVRGSIPSPSHKTVVYGGNTPCVEVITSKYQLIFDCGSGFSKIDFSNNLETIIFISHFHHDHIQGLAFNTFNIKLNKKIILTSAHSNSNDTFKNLTNYYNHPYFPVDFINIINNFKFTQFEQVVSDFKDLNIDSIELNHPGNSSGYSITSDNKKFCYLLDNEYDDLQKDELIEFCNFSDTIIWDGMYLDIELSDKKGWGHSSIEQGINFSNQIEVKNFLISHHAPSREDDEIEQIKKNLFNNKVRFASENEVIDF
jgi:phosphoribosyl 1,2-cyclic phosphodiesterase